MGGGGRGDYDGAMWLIIMCGTKNSVKFFLSVIILITRS